MEFLSFYSKFRVNQFLVTKNFLSTKSPTHIFDFSIFNKIFGIKDFKLSVFRFPMRTLIIIYYFLNANSET